MKISLMHLSKKDKMQRKAKHARMNPDEGHVTQQQIVRAKQEYK